MNAPCHAAVLFGVWLAADVPLAGLWALARRRTPRLPVEYGPLPVPLVASVALDPWVALLAVDAVLWSYADAVGSASWPVS